MKKNNVAVLLSSYNGEKYIEEQIESIFNQENVNLHLFVRDDGSTDGTIEILKKIESKHDNITVFYEKNIGYAKSFWKLMSYDNSFDYYSFCDQDDVWLEKKLISAINMINEEEKKIEDMPILYTSRVISINNNKKVLRNNTFNNNRNLNVYESFQKSAFPGCVFVFNKKARDILIKYNGYMESHDWAAYCIISVFGKTIYDNNSYILYRIHDNNAIGKRCLIIELFNKIKRFFLKSKNTRSKFAKEFYDTYKDYIPDFYLCDIYQLSHYRLSKKIKIKLLFNRKIRGFVFKLYVFLNKI